MGRFQAECLSPAAGGICLAHIYMYVYISLVNFHPVQTERVVVWGHWYCLCSCVCSEYLSVVCVVSYAYAYICGICVFSVCACWEYIFGLVTARTQGHGTAVALLLSGCWIQHDIFSSDKLVSMCCNFKAPGRIPAWQTDITSVCTLRYSVFSSVIKCLVWELQISTRFFLCSPPVRCVRTHITNHLMWGGAHRVTDTKNLLKTDLLPVNLSWRWMINNSKIRQNCYLVVIVL